MKIIYKSHSAPNVDEKKDVTALKDCCSPSHPCDWNLSPCWRTHLHAGDSERVPVTDEVSWGICHCRSFTWLVILAPSHHMNQPIVSTVPIITIVNDNRFFQPVCFVMSSARLLKYVATRMPANTSRSRWKDAFNPRNTKAAANAKTMTIIALCVKFFSILSFQYDLNNSSFSARSVTKLM